MITTEILKEKLNRQTVKDFLGHYWNVLRSALHPPQLSNSELLDMLDNWNIDKINSTKVLGGNLSSNWLIKTAKDKYVLRNAGSNRAYIDFQIFVTDELTRQGFPYSIPQFLLAGPAYYVKFRDDFYVLYKFVEGRLLKRVDSIEQARSMGQLVARFHKITRKINDISLKSFALPLFEIEPVTALFQDSLEVLNTRKRHTAADKLFLAQANLFLEAIAKIPDSDKAKLNALETMPIYDDWHGYNIVSDKGKITGLIDFDSLVTAPKIVDIQNGLLYAAGTKNGVELSRLRAFIQGYSTILPLSASELALVYSVMIDRVTAIISDILLTKKTNGAQYGDNVLIFLITQLAWIINNEQEFTNNLFAALETGNKQINQFKRNP